MAARARADHELPSATERVAKFRLYFRQISLAELEKAELLEVDWDEQEVKEGPRFDEKWSEVFE